MNRQSPTSMSHPFLIYTAARIGLLIAFGAACYLLGARGILLIVLAFLLSGLASFILLNRSRGQVGASVGAYFSRINRRIEESTTAEDYDDPELASATQRNADSE